MFSVKPLSKIKNTMLKDIQSGGGLFSDLTKKLIELKELVGKLESIDSGQIRDTRDKINSEIKTILSNINKYNTEFKSPPPPIDENALNNIEILKKTIHQLDSNVFFGLEAQRMNIPVFPLPPKFKNINALQIEIGVLLKKIQDDMKRNITIKNIDIENTREEIKKYENLYDDFNEFNNILNDNIKELKNNLNVIINVNDIRTQDAKTFVDKKLSYVQKIDNSFLGTMLKPDNFNVNTLTKLIRDTGSDEMLKDNGGNVVNLLVNPSDDTFKEEKKVQTGGNPQVDEQIEEFNRLTNKMNKLELKVNKNLEKYNELRTSWIIFHYYLILVSTDRFVIENYYVYEYINYGTIVFYMRIIDDIMKKIEFGNPLPAIKYFKKCHFVTLNLMKNFLNELKKVISLRTHFKNYKNLLDGVYKGESEKKGDNDENIGSYIQIISSPFYNDAIQKADNNESLTYDKKTADKTRKPGERNNIIMRNDELSELTNTDDIPMLIPDNQVLNISDCTDNVKKYMFIFNHFKFMLEKYNAGNQNKVAVYLRLNDEGGMINKDFKKKTFSSKKNSYDGLIINSNMCETWNRDENKLYETYKTELKSKYPSSIGNVSEITFSEVFDNAKLSDNSILTDYMRIKTSLALGESIMFLTYGYSGTGKTYTMFGKNDIEKNKYVPGILQSTITYIEGLTQIFIRVYEVYGKGVPYSNYWKNGSKHPERVNNVIYPYDLSEESNVLVPLEAKAIPRDPEKGFIEIKNFAKAFAINKTTKIAKSKSDIKDDNSYYYEIPFDKKDDIFRSFSEFTDKLDIIRKEKNRITETPNNNVSSRSILVYEFELKINNNVVSLVIIDLPGREEIVQTYVDPYVNFLRAIGFFKGNEEHQFNHNLELKGVTGDEKKEQYRETYIKTILAACALNPLYLAALTPDEIISYINEEMGKDQKFRYDFLNNPIEVTMTITGYTAAINKQIADKFAELSDESKIAVDSKDNPLYYSYNNGIVYSQKTSLLHELVSIYYNGNIISYKLKNLINYDTDENKFIFISDSRIGNRAQISREINDIQYNVIVALHFMNRLILMGKFDSIEKICKKIIDKYVNNTNLLNKIKKIYTDNGHDEFKKKYVIEYRPTLYRKDKASKLFFDSNQPIPLVYEKLKYNYFSTTYEGIYINENIVGLLKTLLKHSSKELDLSIIKEQDTTKLEFENQKNILRKSNEVLYIEEDKTNRLHSKVDSDGKKYEFISWSYKPTGISPVYSVRKLDYDNNGDTIFQQNYDSERDNVPVKWENIKLNITKVEKIYNEIKTDYASDKLFSYKDPYITNILGGYFGKTDIYKMFYLIKNNKDNCAEQLKLLIRTVPIIQELIK
jgi:hypothetical protein